MDPEREDYDDPELAPQPLRRPPVEIILGLVGAVFLSMMVAAFLLHYLVMAYAG